MARLPQPGGDDGEWGAILNDYLLEAHASDGGLKDGIVTEAAFDAGIQTKLGNIESGLAAKADSTALASVATSGSWDDLADAGVKVILLEAGAPDPDPPLDNVLYMRKTA
jgi:hypothetical protein